MDDYELEPGQEAQLFGQRYLEVEALQRRARLSAEVIVDLQRKGPIYALVMAKRELAAGALDQLIDIDPTDSAGIARLQAQIMAFLVDCQWIHAKLEDGKEADTEIELRWGAKHDGPDRAEE